MTLDDCIVSYDMPTHGIAPFTRDWQAALVAIGRARTTLERATSCVNAFGAWTNDQGNMVLEREGNTTLLLDIRLIVRNDPIGEDGWTMSERAMISGSLPDEDHDDAPRPGMPGTGRVDLGIKAPLEWFRNDLSGPKGPETVASGMLDAARTVLQRIHLMEKGVATERDALEAIGAAFLMRDAIGIREGTMKMMHPTPWSANCAVTAAQPVRMNGLTMPGTVIIDPTGLGIVPTPWIVGTLKDRMAPLTTSGDHPPMNLLLAPMATYADPDGDPVVRLRSEAAWRAKSA
jgi:hypothetical protein